MDTPVVFLGQRGEIRQSKLKATTPAAFASLFKKKEPPTLLGTYVWAKKYLYLLGYLDGKSGTENQHHLPPPLEGMTFFGDILVVYSQTPNSYTKLIPLKTADYETFYTNKLEGDEEEEEIEETPQEEVEADVEIPDEESETEEYGGAVSSDDEAEAEVEADEENAEEESVIIPEKPVRVARVKKVVAVHVDEPEIDLNECITDSPYRVKMLEVIQNTLSSKLSYDEQSNLEKIIYNTSLQNADKEEIRKVWSQQSFRDVYFSVGRRILGNMNPHTYVKNKGLWDRFSTKELTLEQIANQNYYELCPDVWQQMVDRQAKRERIQLEGDFSRATDKYFCMGCKMRKCTYYELQTRSADEPMTIFIHCLNCGKRWTQ
jgi:DNA-directed RNA polymerase subunit M/transcription elongation factor TFIIS